ncbi:hypothetical protein FIBSPDRAFT_902054 [Athelia psychrophila]|uniref:Uncharacterized protein n=1 Tax=Athelia psychrophila TaxID=1759441 RepID=A0A167XR17_9AGAM|nr:hypothetical protein FIBSPDRAFT_902054 [Fibularhizoctonia sp. CBS 109695]
MPAVRAPASRVQRHFSPLTMRTTFKQEHFSTPPPIAYHIVYPAGTHTPKSTAANPFTSDKPKSKALLKKKPDGEVTRINRGGYNLQAELKWADKLDQTCQKTLSQTADRLLDLSKTWPEQTAAKKKEFLNAETTGDKGEYETEGQVEKKKGKTGEKEVESEDEEE